MENELEAIDVALSTAVYALESDSDLEQRRQAFETIQELYEQDRLLSYDVNKSEHR